jgi:hypothetical protein
MYPVYYSDDSERTFNDLKIKDRHKRFLHNEFYEKFRRVWGETQKIKKIEFPDYSRLNH